MDDLPFSIVTEILTRLHDTADLTRCCAVSKSLNTAAREVRSLSHLCNAARYRECRAASKPIPFKPALVSLSRICTRLDSVSVAVDIHLGRLSYDDTEDDADDLYLTDAGFLRDWLPIVAGGLRSLAISDFWSQSSWRNSQALAVISSCCCNLDELVVKNAWLSVDGLKPMPKLTSLTLEFIRLDDENLNKVSACFLGLEVLNLIGVGGLKDPKVNLARLKTFRWTISNAPNSLTVVAPNLVGLEIQCVRPKSLILETPSLTDLRLTIQRIDGVRLSGFSCLKSLELVSQHLCSLLGMFHSSTSIETLTVDVPIRTDPALPGLSLRMFDSFPDLSSLTLGPGAWSEIGFFYHLEGSDDGLIINGLKELTARLKDIEIYTDHLLISHILSRCTNISEIGLHTHIRVDPTMTYMLVSKCKADWPRVKWRSEFWD